MDFFVGNRINRTVTTRFRAQIEKEERFGEKSIAVAQAGISVSFLILHIGMCLSKGHSVYDNILTIGLIVFTLLAIARFLASQDELLKPGLFNVLTILDGITILALLVSYMTHYGSVHQLQFTAAPLFIMSVFVGLRALQSDPVQVIFSGLTITIGLGISVIAIPLHVSDGSFSWMAVQSQANQTINIGSVFENIISMAVLTAVITVGVVRSRRLLSNSTHVDDLREERKKVETLSCMDTLTGLANRAEFKRRLDKSIQVLAKNSRQSAVMILDLDRFKSINDTIGHPAGDKFLRQLGERLKNSVRDTDLVARLGGDEFAVLLENIKDMESVDKLSDRLTGEIRSTLLDSFPELQIDTSVGISIATQDGTDAEQLIENAEIALAKSKEKGRGYSTIFSEEFRKNLQHENTLENDLRYGLKNDQLMVYFQPKYCFQSGAVNSVEALVRWQHPEKGLISPGEFIPAAERSGLIVDIGQFVLAKTCDFIQRAEKENLAIDRVAINVAAREFMSNDSFSKNLMQTIRARGISPRKIELEITEQVLLDRRSEHVFDIFDRLRSEGVHISLDDFGTGYASLIHLASCPINAIKLDRTFVAGINTNKRETAIVSAISRMAKELDLQITAEGVETLEQFEFVRHSGCDFVQGYYVARPLHEDHLVDFLKYHNSRLYSIAV